jgi:hypothetical protein
MLNLRIIFKNLDHCAYKKNATKCIFQCQIENIFCYKIFKDLRRNRTVLNSQITTNVQDGEGNVPENL